MSDADPQGQTPSPIPEPTPDPTRPAEAPTWSSDPWGAPSGSHSSGAHGIPQNPFAAPSAGAYDPYAAPQPATPYPPSPGAPTPQAAPYASAPYGTPYPGTPQPGGYGQPYPPGYAPYGVPYAPAQVVPTNTSAIVLLVVSGICALSSCFLLGLPSGILAILGLTTNATDPVGARKKAAIGWWVFAVNALVAVTAVVAFAVWADTNGYLDEPYPSPGGTVTTDIGY